MSDGHLTLHEIDGDVEQLKVDADISFVRDQIKQITAHTLAVTAAIRAFELSKVETGGHKNRRARPMQTAHDRLTHALASEEWSRAIHLVNLRQSAWAINLPHDFAALRGQLGAVDANARRVASETAERYGEQVLGAAADPKRPIALTSLAFSGATVCVSVLPTDPLSTVKQRVAEKAGVGKLALHLFVQPRRVHGNSKIVELSHIRGASMLLQRHLHPLLEELSSMRLALWEEPETAVSLGLLEGSEMVHVLAPKELSPVCSGQEARLQQAAMAAHLRHAGEQSSWAGGEAGDQGAGDVHEATEPQQQLKQQSPHPMKRARRALSRQEGSRRCNLS